MLVLETECVHDCRLLEKKAEKHMIRNNRNVKGQG